MVYPGGSGNPAWNYLWVSKKDVINDGAKRREVKRSNRKETRDLTWKTPSTWEGKTTVVSQQALPLWSESDYKRQWWRLTRSRVNQSPMENPNGIIWPVPYSWGYYPPHPQSRPAQTGYNPTGQLQTPLRSGPSLHLYTGLHYAPSEVVLYLVHMNLDHHSTNSTLSQIPSCSINKEPLSWTHQKKQNTFGAKQPLGLISYTN
jgi:hypothetical protein